MSNIVRALRTFLCLSPIALATLARGNPNGGTVVAGNVDPLPATGVNFDIGIHSQRAIIDWQSFSIQLGETTRFNFDAASGAVLNRVTVVDPANLSVIAGRLESNGQVILLNPNGIMITPSGVIDTRSFVGTTLSIDPGAFMNGGRFTFEGSADGSIVNQGVVLAREKEGLPGGDVVLIAQTVRNDGTIAAPDGLAALAAGTKVTLYDTGDQRIVVETSAPDAEVVNGPEGVIAAVTAELKAVGGNIGALAINNEGVIRANTIVEEGGRVFLRAGNGTVVNSGTIEARGNAPGTSGGHVEVTGNQVLLASGSRIDASGPAGGGTVLVGGDYQGANPEVPNALRVAVAPDAVIDVSATVSGNGGRAIVWADEVNRFYGYIAALGGPQGGNGGFVETSGKEHLEAVGLVNASAPLGVGGVWLLDPRNVTIDNAASAGGTFNAGTPNVFTPTADDAIADRNAIQTSLNAGTSVQITTGASGTQAGNITVAATGAITKTAGGNATLTLDAANNILINAPISATVGQLGITLNAAAGSVTVNSDLTSNGGAISLSGPTGLNLNANLNAGGGAVDLNHAVVLGANVTITGVGITFDSTVNADDAATQDRILNVAGGAGAVTFSGNVGTTEALADLNVTAGTINLSAATVKVDDDFDDGAGNTVSFTGAVVLGANVEVDTAGTTDNAVNFSSTVARDGTARTLTVGAGTADITFGDNVGSGANPLGALAVNTTGVGAFDGTVNAASLTTDAGGTTGINGGAVTTTGIQDYGDDVVLGSALTVLTGTTPTFGGTVDGNNQDLTLNFSGNHTLDGADLTDLNDLAVGNGGTTTLLGTITTSGNQTYTDNVTLGDIVTVTSSGDGTIAFNGTVNADDAGANNRALTINAGAGTATLGGVVGGTEALADLDINAATINLNAAGVTVDDQGGNTVTLNGAVVLGANAVSIDTDGATDNNVNFTGTVNADNAGTQNRALAVNAGTGSVTFGDNVGATQSLADLDVTAGAINLNAATVRVEDQGGNSVGFNGPVVLGANVTVDTDGTADNSANFAGTINADDATANNRILTVTAGGGTATFGGSVGTGTAGTLADLNVTAATINLNAATVQVDDDFDDGAGNTVSFTGAVVLGANVSVDTDGTTDNAVNFAATVNRDGTARTLTVGSGSADVSFSGNVGTGANPLGALTVNTTGVGAFDGSVNAASLTTDANGTTGINGGAVTTTGDQTYNDDVVLGDDTVLTGGTPSFAGTITGGGNDLTLNFSGPTTVDGAEVTGVANLTTGNGGTTTLVGTIVTTGDQDYNDDIVTPAGTTTLTGNTITFDGRLSPGGDIDIGLLAINGDLVLDNDALYFVNLNGTTAGQFDQIDVNAGAVAINATASIDGTAGFAFVLNDTLPVIIKDAGESRSGDFDAGGDEVTLSGQLFEIDYNNNVNDTFAVRLLRDVTTWTWDGSGPNANWSTRQNWVGLNQPSDVFAPAVGDSLVFEGNVGLNNNNNVPGLILSQIIFNAGSGSFTLNGPEGVSLLGGVVNNSASLQSINLPVTLAGNAVMNAAAGQIRFNSVASINGNFDLALNGANLITLGAPVGGSAALNSLVATAPVALNGGTVTTTGVQTYNDDVTLGANTVLTGSVPTFGGTVDGNNNDLTLNFTGATLIDGAVITDVNDLASGNGGATTLQGAITTSGTQTYNDNVTLGAATTLAGTTATFGGTFDGGNQDLTLNLSDPTTIDGAFFVNVNDLASGGTGVTTLLGTITTTGNQTYDDDVVLADNVTVTSSGNGTIAFNGAVDADDAVANDRTLTVNAGTGTATFGDVVGGAQALADLDVNAGAINLDGAALTVDDQGGNTIGFNGDVTLGADVTINAGGATGNSITFAGTVDGGQALVVNSGGTVAFDGVVGGATPLDSLTTDAGGLTALNGGAVTTTGTQVYNDAVTLGANTVLAGTIPTFGGVLTGNGNDLTLSFSGATLVDGAVITGVRNLVSDGNGTTTVQGNLTTTGTQTYDDDVLLGGTATLASSGAGAAGDITFNGTVDGNDVLFVNTQGTTTFGDLVGGIAPLVRLLTDAGGTTALTGGGVTTSGFQDYGDNVTLGAAATLTGTTVNFGGTLAGNNNDLTLALSGSSTVDGAVITGVNDLVVGNGGSTILQGNLTTTGTQTYDDDVTLGAATSLAGTTVSFNGNVAGGNNSLDVTGAAVIGDAAADTVSGVSTLTVNGNTTINAGSVASTGNQDYNGNLTLGGGGAKNLAASQVAVDGNVVGGNSDLTITGAAVLGDAQADTVTGLAGLTVTGGTTLNAASVNTGAGNQDYQGGLTLAGGAKTLTGNAGTFGGTLTGGGNNLTLTFSGPSTLDGGTVLGVNDLVVNGGGTTTLQGNLATLGTQTYDDDLLLGGATTVASTGAGAAGNITFNGAIDGTQSLVVNTAGATIFNDAVGAGTALASLTTDAPGTVQLNGGTITTTGGQTFNDPAVLGAATTLASTAAGNISFNGTLNGGQTLAVNTAGQTGFGGAVGALTPVTSITTDAPGTVFLTGGTMITSGAQLYNDPVTLGADTAFSASTLTFGGGLNPNGFAVGTVTVGDQIFANPYVLSSDTFLVSTAGRIEFQSTVNSDATPRSLTLNSPLNTIFGGAVGAVSPLQNLTTDAAGQTLINGGQVNALGTVTFNDAVVLGADTTVAAGTVTFAGTVNAAAAGVQGLVVNSPGITTFGGVVGGNAALEHLQTDDAAGGDSTVLAANVTTTTTQNYGDTATVGGNLNGTGIAFGNGVTFNGAGNQAVSAGTGALAIGGAATKTTAGNLSLDGDAGVSVGGALAVNNGSLTVGDPLVAASVAASQNISLVSVNTPGAVTATAGSVAVTGTTTAGSVAAGTSVNLAGVANVTGNVVAGTTAQFGAVSDVGGNVSAGGAATFTGPASIGGNVTGTGITFNNTATLDGAADQTVNAGTGTLTANSTVTKTGTGSLTLAGDGGVNVTGNLAVTPAAGNLTVQDNLTAGAAVSAAQNVTLNGTTSSAVGNVTATAGNVAAGTLTAANVAAGGGVTATALTTGNVNAGGAVNVANNATLTGALTAGGPATVGGAADINGNITAGGLVTFGGAAALAGNVTGVGITFNNTAAFDGAGAQLAEAGTGALTAASTVTKTGAGNLTLGGDGGINVTGNLAVNTAGGSLTVNDNLTAGGTVTAPVNVSLANANVTGALTATTGNLTGGNTTAASVTAGGSVSLASVSAGSVTAGTSINVAGATTVGGNLTAGTTINVGGIADVNGMVTGGGLVAFGSAASLAQNVTGNGITFGGAVTLDGAGAQTLNAGPGTLVANSTLNKTAGALNLRATEIDFNGGAGSVNGGTGLAGTGGILNIQTTDPSGTIGLGTLTVGNTPARLDLNAGDTAALGSGFSRVEVGDATTRHIAVGSGATFAAPVLALRSDALGAANMAIQQEVTGSLTANTLEIQSVGQVLLGNATGLNVGDLPTLVSDAQQPANQIRRLGPVTVDGNFYLYDGGAPEAYLAGEEGSGGTSPFFLDPNVDNRRGLEIADDFTQDGSGVFTVIRTAGDLNVLPGADVQTGLNNLTVLSAEVHSSAPNALANFHNAGATGNNGVENLAGPGGIFVGSNSRLLVYFSDVNFNTFQRGAGFNVNSASQNGVLPTSGQFHLGRIETDPVRPDDYPLFSGVLITPNVFNPLQDAVEFYARSTEAVFVEANKFVFFDFAPEPFAGITLDTQSFRTGLARPGTEIRTHSSLLYDFEEWYRQGRPAVNPPTSSDEAPAQ